MAGISLRSVDVVVTWLGMRSSHGPLGGDIFGIRIHQSAHVRCTADAAFQDACPLNGLRRPSLAFPYYLSIVHRNAIPETRSRLESANAQIVHCWKSQQRKENRRVWRDPDAARTRVNHHR